MREQSRSIPRFTPDADHPALRHTVIPNASPDEGLESTLRTGERVSFRALGPGDRTEVEEHFRRLDPTSLRRRFLTPVPTLDRRLLAPLLSLGGSGQEVWGAFHHGQLVAEGRFVVFADEPAIAEIAATVSDAWQGRGLGGLLFEALALAALDRGIRTLRYAIAGDNPAAARLLSSFGGRLRWSCGLGEGELPVAAFLRGRLETATAQNLAQASGW